jgi:hypothetical protein
VSDDGGKNFREMKEERKHSDNHALVFREDDPDYLLIGTDAGLYESFDLAENWRFIDNMPIPQYYKVAVDDREPFYHIFGGTQDNGSHGGPSRTDSEAGIRNGDWYKTLFADGHQSATEPGNPDIIYAETQQGGLHRVDLKTGEPVMVQPQAREGEPHERFNWDAPIVVSPHDPKRLYFASYRVWRSDNRGDDWTPISEDLTRNEERLTLPIMGGVQSWDNPWDVRAMSNYNTITSLSESPVREGLIYAGTDDGILQVTEDGGDNWRKIMVGNMQGVPERAFINDVKADLYDAGTVYVSLDNHKEGDYTPYLLKSTDMGRSWESLTANLEDRTLIWRLVQDHEDPNLLFIGTENGIYTSLDGGGEWEKLAGTPTIPFRDLAIQKRENDLVGASFGRSFWVFDDYSALRELDEVREKEVAHLFTPRDAWWYSERNNDPGVGANIYAAENPDFGALLTYYLPEGYETTEKQRKEREKELAGAGEDIPFPGYDALDAESAEETPAYWITIYGEEGNVIRKLRAQDGKGLHRIAWDLRYPSTRAIRPGQSDGGGRWSAGPLVPPGEYAARLMREHGGEVEELAGPVTFRVKPLHDTSIPAPDPREYQAYREEVKRVQDQLAAAQEFVQEARTQVQAMEVALERSATVPGNLNGALYSLKQELREIEKELNGSPSRNEIGERNDPTVSDRFSTAYRGLTTTYGPTGNHRQSLRMAEDQLGELMPKVERLRDETIPNLQESLREAGAPYIIGASRSR